jgi:DNA helicase-2/ATP-dependent DNA helicase PcrA
MTKGSASVPGGVLCNLTANQREAATYYGGPLLIVAGPGSGKTEVISCRAAFFIKSGKVKPENLFAATFTERAALSLKDRIQQKLPELNVEAMQVSTIHSFCYRLLEEFRDEGPFPRGFRILDEAGQRLFVYSRRRELGLSEIMKGRECDFFGEVLRLYNLAAEELVQPARFEVWCRKQAKAAPPDESRLWDERLRIAHSYGRYLELMAEAGLTDFSNLQRHALELLKRRPAVLKSVRERFRELLIDEYQDTNAVQEELIFRIAGPEYHLTVVGDDDQSIYRFRGATVKNILNFGRKLGQVKVIKLEDNFRSVQPIIDHASLLIRCNPREARLDKALRCKRLHLTNDVAVVHENSAVQEADAVATVLKHLHSSGSIGRFNDVAVLLRSVRSYAQPYLGAFETAAIPFRVIGDGRFFEREDISQICGLFTFLSTDKPWGDKFVRCGVMGLSQETEKALSGWKNSLADIAADRELRKAGVRDPADRSRLLDLIDLKRRVLKKSHRSLLEVLYRILKITGYFGLAQSSGDSEAVRNLGILTRTVADFDAHGGTRNIHPFMSYLQLLRDGAMDSFHDDPKDAVSVMTVHQAKGLEFPVVVIGAAMDGRFPSRRRRCAYEIPYSLTRSGAPEVEDPHQVDERKLFYVAATRARDLLVIATADVVNKRGGGASPFIRELIGDRLAAAERLGRELSRRKPTVEEGGALISAPRLRLSFYDLAYYYQCPMRYKYFVVDGMASLLSNRLYFGSAVHRALELLHRDVRAGKTVVEEDAASYVGRAWIPLGGSARGGDGETEDRKLLEAAVVQVSRYVKEHRGTFGCVETPELPFAFDEEGTIVAGRIDLVRRSEAGKKEVVDFKTYASKAVEREQAGLQMELYALGLERSAGLGVARHTLHFLEDNVVLTENWDPAQRAAVEAKVRKVVGQIRGAEFQPRTEYCPACVEFQEICPYFRAADRAQGTGTRVSRGREGVAPVHPKKTRRGGGGR